MLDGLGLAEKIAAGLLAAIGASITAIGVYLAGERSGKAQFITAASTAADLMLKQQNLVIARLEARLAAVEGREHDCQKELAELREQLAAFRLAAGFPPYTPPAEAVTP